MNIKKKSITILVLVFRFPPLLYIHFYLIKAIKFKKIMLCYAFIFLFDLCNQNKKITLAFVVSVE